MLTQCRLFAMAVAVVAVGLVVFVARRRLHGQEPVEPVDGGVLIGAVGAYDRFTGFVLGPLYSSLAAEIARTSEPDTRILEVGCGPGHLALRLANDHGRRVMGLDLDPAMIELAKAKAARTTSATTTPPAFVVGDAADLPFQTGSFDLAVSTLSLHHWADPEAGIAEIGRVLRPGGRALVWDLEHGLLEAIHGDVPDPGQAVEAGGMRVVSTRRWRWPWRFSFLQQVELEAE